MRKDGEISGCGKNSRVASNSFHNTGVFVLDFALNDSVSEGPIICGRRSLRFPLCWRIECGMRHAQWPENFAPAKMIKRLAGNPFKSHSQQDESYVAVLRVRTGRIL